MKTVLVSLPVQARHKEILEKAGEGCRFVYVEPADLTEELIASTQVLIGPVSPKQLKAPAGLELLQLHSAGAENFVVPGVLAETTLLCNATGAYGKAVSEHALALTLSLLKKLYLYRDGQLASRWEDRGAVTSLTDAVVVVVGLGDIGLSYARLVKTLGAKKVIGVKRRPGKLPEGVDELCLTAEIDRVLPEADLVVSFLPGTKDTLHFFTPERFAQMKKTAYYVNCGRGSVVSNETLLHALESGDIAAAAVDVLEIEPLPADSPLWKLENLVITPHTAGYPHLPEIIDRIVDIAAANLRALLTGGEPITPVDRSTGYKK